MTRLLLIALLAPALVGCSAWNEEKLERATVAAIDDTVSRGMGVDEFLREFPEAELIDGDRVSGRWLVSRQRVCFLCETAAGFSRSREIYVRVIRFDNGVLQSVEDLPRG